MQDQVRRRGALGMGLGLTALAAGTAAGGGRHPGRGAAR